MKVVLLTGVEQVAQYAMDERGTWNPVDSLSARLIFNHGEFTLRTTLEQSQQVVDFLSREPEEQAPVVQEQPAYEEGAEIFSASEELPVREDTEHEVVEEEEEDGVDQL